MKNNKKRAEQKISFPDLFGFIFAAFYLQTMLTVAHHTAMLPHDGSTYTVGPPSVPVLITSILLIGYSSYKNKWTLTTLNVVSLTILVTSSIFWLSGLRTNFYF